MNASSQVTAIRRLIADVSKIVLIRERCQLIGREFVRHSGYLESYHGFRHSAGRIPTGGGGEESSPEVHLYWTINTGEQRKTPEMVPTHHRGLEYWNSCPSCQFPLASLPSIVLFLLTNISLF